MILKKKTNKQKSPIKIKVLKNNTKINFFSCVFTYSIIILLIFKNASFSTTFGYDINIYNFY